MASTASETIAAAEDFRAIAQHAQKAEEALFAASLELEYAKDVVEDRAAARAGKTRHVCPVCDAAWWGEPDERCTAHRF